MSKVNKLKEEPKSLRELINSNDPNDRGRKSKEEKKTLNVTIPYFGQIPEDGLEVIRDYVDFLNMMEIPVTKGHLCETIEILKYRLMIEPYVFSQGNKRKDEMLALHNKYYNPKYQSYLDGNEKGETK